MPGSVIVSTARTPIGKLSGGFASFSAMDLGGAAIRAALERGGVGPDQIDYVIMGHVLQAGQGQITARQAAVLGGIPMTVPAITINKVCLSGINALYMADQMIQSGDAEVVVAGGMESMTNAPYLLPKARAGYRMGNGELIDSLIHDGLWCAFDAMHMGEGTDKYTEQFGGLTRELQDEFAARSSWKRTKASGPAPPSSRSASSARPSRRTAPSPPATRRRSPTVAPR
jgi:acetyl-CoA C-acetyltransferase